MIWRAWRLRQGKKRYSWRRRGGCVKFLEPEGKPGRSTNARGSQSRRIWGTFQSSVENGVGGTVYCWFRQQLIRCQNILHPKLYIVRGIQRQLRQLGIPDCDDHYRHRTCCECCCLQTNACTRGAAPHGSLLPAFDPISKICLWPMGNWDMPVVSSHPSRLQIALSSESIFWILEHEWISNELSNGLVL